MKAVAYLWSSRRDRNMVLYEIKQSWWPEAHPPSCTAGDCAHQYAPLPAHPVIPSSLGTTPASASPSPMHHGGQPDPSPRFTCTSGLG